MWLSSAQKVPTYGRRCDSRAERDIMTWEREHRSTGGQWTLTVGAWRAVVQRVAGPRLLWQATIERSTTPRDCHVSPLYMEAMDGRTWCLRRIAELADEAP
jgi:hypothetical protein